MSASTPSPTILQALRNLVQHVDDLVAHLQATDRLRPCFVPKGLAEAKSALAEFDQAWPLRDQIGKALAEGLHEAGSETDWFDARNVDELAERVLAVVPLPATLESTDEPDPENQGARDVLAERIRQISQEEWTPEHDDEHDPGELAAAACAYALAAADKLAPMSQGDGGFDEAHPTVWPWDSRWWKPGEARRMLVKSSALALAEIERMDRAAARHKGA